MKSSRNLKKQDLSSKLVLQEIIGLTTKNANGLASAVCSSRCFYLAGCVVVIYDADCCTQSHLIVSHRMPKPLSCVTVSKDGRFVAAGESGNLSAVLVWNSETLAFVSELKGHLYEVEDLAFSPNGEYLVTVGGYIYLWDWQRSILLTKLKANATSSAVTSVNFSSDGNFIVTAGNKHLKLWTFGSLSRTRSNKAAGLHKIHGKPLDLGLHRGSSYVSITSSSQINTSRRNVEQPGQLFSIYALTDAGVLCLMNSSLSVTKSVDLKVEKGFAISASNHLIACACSKGVVQLFTIETLEYAGLILYSEAKMVHGENHTACQFKGYKDDLQIQSAPDAVACQFLTKEKLVVIYGDHSLYVWDICDVNKVTRCSMMISHSACIWDIKNLCCGNMHNPSVACVARGCSGGISFATCSADGTVRLWDLSSQLSSLGVTMDSKSLDSEPVEMMHLASAGIFEQDLVEASISGLGFRSLAASQDGKYLAAGDSEGNLHIYDLQTSEYTCFKDVHNAEILSLSFNLPSVKDVDSEKVSGKNYLLASGGRDRAIHLYDVKRNFDLVESISNHSAAVTSVKLPFNGCKILSSSADRSLVFRDVLLTKGGLKVLHRHHQMASRGTVYDMTIDPKSELAVTVGQDKKINIYDVATGKFIRSFKQDKDYGDPIKVIVDPSCNYLVCSYSNRTICMFDFITGELVAQAVGHSEVVTGIIFLPDCKHLVSVGGDGCIFVWKVPSRISFRMIETVKESADALSAKTLVQPSFRLCIKEDLQVEETKYFEEKSSPWTSSFKFSISRLPKWAQAKVTSSHIVPMNQECNSAQWLKPEQKVSQTLVDDHADHSSLSLECQTPRHQSQSAESCLSSLSKGSTDTITSAVQNAVGSNNHRWNTVYNVCLDLLNSPEVQILKDVNVTFSSVNMLKDQEKVESSMHEIIVDGQLQSNITEPTTEDIHVDCSTEHTDMFKQFFGSLSTLDKVKIEKSSQARRYSSQYFLRRDYFGDNKQPFSTPFRILGQRALNIISELNPHDMLKNPPVQNSGEQQSIDSTKQNLNDASQAASNAESSECPDKENPQKIESAEATVQTEPNLVGNSVQESINSCREALQNLNTAAENLFQLVSELAILLPKEGISTGPGVWLYDETTKMLPEISQKINAVAKIIKGSKHESYTEGNKNDSFETFI